MVSITQEPFRVQKKQEDFSFEMKTFHFLIFKKQKEKRRKRKERKKLFWFQNPKIICFQKEKP